MQACHGQAHGSSTDTGELGSAGTIRIMADLAEVFGISADPRSASYVDRGGLDLRFQRALAADRHVAVHGGSKQGKSWLRQKGITEDKALVIQCLPDATPESIFTTALGRLGVHATLSRSKGRELSGTLDFTGAGTLGNKLLGAIELTGGASGSVSKSSGETTAPIGQTIADLAWVSRTIVASGKRLVLEDFHYTDERVQRDLAFMLKAMGEYGLFVIVIGVWPKDHLLTYYNGDLDGRIEDIHLTWERGELESVITQGCEELNIEILPTIRSRVVDESFGSVGLLQRLAEQLCQAEGVYETHPGRSKRQIGSEESLSVALSEVARQMQNRFQNFADNFVRGMRRLPDGLEVYRHILQVASHASDEELKNGIDSQALQRRIVDDRIRASDLTQALDRIDKLQVKIEVNPLVLTYSKSGRRLHLADRAFLFFRKHGRPQWPWDEPDAAITNDLAVQDPLDIEWEPHIFASTDESTAAVTDAT